MVLPPFTSFFDAASPYYRYNQRILAYRESITVRLTSCFICMDSAALLVFNNNRFTCLVESIQTEGQPSGDTSPVSEYSSR